MRYCTVLPPKGFYTVHGTNALFIARTFYRTTAVVKYYGPEGKAGASPAPNTPQGGSEVEW